MQITTIINHFKSIYREMPQHITNGRMFEQRDQIRHCGSVNPMEDSVIESVSVLLAFNVINLLSRSKMHVDK